MTPLDSAGNGLGVRCRPPRRRLSIPPLMFIPHGASNPSPTEEEHAMTGARCGFCRRTFRNPQAVRAHLKTCAACRQLPKAALPSKGSVKGGAAESPRMRSSTAMPDLPWTPKPDAARSRPPAARPTPHAADGAVKQFLRRAAIQAVKRDVLDSGWAVRHPVPAEIKAQALATIERELSRLPTDELPHAELVTIAEGIRNQLYAPVLAAQQRARDDKERQQAHQLLRPLRLEGGLLHARRWLGRHADLDMKTRTDLERTVRQALDRDLDGSESDVAVQRRVEKILEDAIKPIEKARRETMRQALIARGAEYAAEELAQVEDLSSWERTSIARDVKRALEDEITGTESDREVEALVDDLLDDVLEGPADEEEDDCGPEDDD